MSKFESCVQVMQVSALYMCGMVGGRSKGTPLPNASTARLVSALCGKVGGHSKEAEAT